MGIGATDLTERLRHNLFDFHIPLAGHMSVVNSTIRMLSEHSSPLGEPPRREHRMSQRITREVVESFLRCKSKAHMKVLGEHGAVTDYELLLMDKRREVRKKVIDGPFARHETQVGGVLRDIPVTRSVLERGPTLVLDTRVEDEFLSLDFDALRKVPGSSSLGDFHYVPVIYHPGQNLRKEQRLMLAVLGSVLGDVQGRQPDLGVIYFGDRCRGTKVRFTRRLKDGASKILREIKDLWRDMSVAANEGANLWSERAKVAMNGSRRKVGRSVIQACLGGAAPKPPEFIA